VELQKSYPKVVQYKKTPKQDLWFQGSTRSDQDLGFLDSHEQNLVNLHKKLKPLKVIKKFDYFHSKKEKY